MINFYSLPVSCGIDCMSVGDKPTDLKFKLMKKEVRASTVLASVPLDWGEAVDFLKRNGFQMIGDPIDNKQHLDLELSLVFL